MRKTRAYLGVMMVWGMMACVFGAVPVGAVARITPDALVAMAGEAVILDARPQTMWAEGHIPGALSFGWDAYTKTDARQVPYRTLPPAEMARALGRLGIDETRPVVITGDADASWGSEGWIAWVLAWVGHRGPVFLLDGGVPGWRAQGRPLEQRLSHGPPTRYAPHPNSAMVISAEALRGHLGAYTLIDTRSFPEWITGHIPGAIHISWKRMVDGRTRTPIPPEAMKALLDRNHVPPGKPVVYYCTGGIRSGWAWMAHTMAGLPPAINLEGGYEEWRRLK